MTDDLPDCGMDDETVELTEFQYSDRNKDDYVVSGPLGDTNGRGRWFDTAQEAEAHYRAKFGRRFRGVIADAEEYGERYAFIIAKVSNG